VLYHDDDNIPDEDDEKEEPKLSKKARKARNKLSVAELKVSCGSAKYNLNTI
jgi:splicing factor 3B subunit 2